MVLDPQTDIKGQLVTVGCSSLKPQAYSKALQGGIDWARQLLYDGIILGAAIFTGPYISVLPESFAAQVEAGIVDQKEVGKYFWKDEARKC